MISRGIGVNGEIVERELSVSAAEIARAQAAAEARRAAMQPPLPPAVILDRLTPDEYGKMIKFAADQLAANNPQPAFWIDKFRLSAGINVASDNFKAAVAEFVLGGAIIQARADIVFAP